MSEVSTPADYSGKYIIFDLDGTLINVNSITHLIGQWDEFAEASLKCPPAEAMVEFARMMQGAAEVLVVTGKSEVHHHAVCQWLRVHGLMPEAVLMRPKLSMDSDAILKPKMMQQYLGDGWKDRVLFVVEDRDKMVEAWRALDIVCLQCAPSLY